MDKFAEWMLINMYRKYYAEIQGWKCLKESGQSCICVSGEMLNHAISAMMMFYSMKDMEYRVEFVNVDDSMCPIIVKYAEENKRIPYIGINEGETQIYDAKTVGFPLCEKGITENRIYIVYKVDAFKEKIAKYDIEEQGNLQKKYDKLLDKMEAEILNNCISTDCNGGNYGLLKSSLMQYALRCMRSLENKEDRNALLAIRFYLTPKASFELLENYMKNIELSEEQSTVISEFLGKYKNFLENLKAESFSLSLFLGLFSDNWDKDISNMLSDCINKFSEKREYEKMLKECLEENEKVDINSLINEMKQVVMTEKNVS